MFLTFSDYFILQTFNTLLTIIGSVSEQRLLICREFETGRLPNISQ